MKVTLLAAGLLGAAPALGCFLQNTDYPGFDVDIVMGKIPNEKACQILCQGNNRCFYWTYVPATRSCYMKSGDAAGHEASREGVSSGPKVCFNMFPDCMEQDLALKGGDLIDTEVVSASACQYQCQNVQNCAFWTFSPSVRRCYLKRAAGVTPTLAPNLVSGPRHCDDASCLPETDLRGYDVHKIEGGVANAALCQKLCVGFETCVYWTYVSTTGSCYLKSGRALQGRRPMPEAYSGNRGCRLDANSLKNLAQPQEESCLLKDVDLPGSNLVFPGVGPVASPGCCRLLCQVTPKCSYITYYGKLCYLKDSTAIKGSTPKEGAISSGKFCDGESTSTTSTPAPPPTSRLDSCLKQDTDYEGADIGTHLGPSAEWCQRFCQADPDCEFFAYGNGVCYLKSAKAASLEVPKKGIVCGPKFCPKPPEDPSISEPPAAPEPAEPEPKPEESGKTASTAEAAAQPANAAPRQGNQKALDVDSLLEFLRPRHQ